ncbi:B3/B4 domain-containing protein [Kaistia granuli]|uniref:B3/B4 domain-containing protein n=1 Tax=Kaistia granuli TaxID=363259 RepID=UPI00036F4196|nr:phenylalanine--tRNA ligase beta subunit-related protein [Kaistia granuli]
MRLDISELVPAFPEFRVSVVLAEDLSTRPVRQSELAELIAAREAESRRAWGRTDLADIPGVAAWRRAYRAFGIKKTSYRSSVERLVKNVLAERPLPVINSFVDAYNAVSLTHVLPLGADDLDRIEGDLAFRYARPGDSFLDMASGENDGCAPVEDPPKDGEVVYADASKVLCRRWNWRQDGRSLVTPQTRRAIVTLQSNGEGKLEDAVADLVDLIGRFSGGRTKVAIADRHAPAVEIG